MRGFTLSATFFLAGMLAATAPAWDAAPSSLAPQAASQPSRNAGSNANQRAADFLNTLNQGEVDTAQMMQSHTQNSQVKDFAKMLQDDHQDSQNKLQSVASQTSLTLGTNATLQKKDQSLTQQLQGESATQADKTFVANEVTDHRQALRQLQRMEPNVTDPQLKSYIQSTIPVLQKHLDAAEKLRSQLGK